MQIPSPYPENFIKKAPTARQNSYATYLYRRGTIFYFRFAFSATQRAHYGKKELRISLGTGFLGEAKKNARSLSFLLEALLMDTEGQKLSYAELKANLIVKFEAFLAKQEPKKEPTFDSIKARMQCALKQMLHNADEQLYRPKDGILFSEDGSLEYASAKEYLEHTFQVFMKEAVGDIDQLMASHYPGSLLHLLKAGFFSPEELTPTSIPKILNEYQKIQVCFNRIMQAREDGDYAYEKTFVSQMESTIVTPTPSSDVTVETTKSTPKRKKAPKGLLLSDFIATYIDTKLEDGQWKAHNVSTHKNRLMAILPILGDVPIQSITRENFRYFRNTLRKMPPNYMKMKKYKDKSVEEIIASEPEQTYSVKTVNTTVEAIASMFEWGVREGLIEKNNARGLQLRDERQDIELREAFTQEDLHKIFFNEQYALPNFKIPAYYWAPLIALYTGMRLEEICQLHCADIQQEGDIWYIDINTKVAPESTEVKLLKNSSAQRQVPLHPVLLEKGFISFVQKVQAAGHERIFPELTKTPSSPKYGKNVGKAFSAHIKKCGITGGKKSFHSLRHTFSHFFKVKNLQNDLFRQIFGHELPELAARQYGGKFSIEQGYREMISLLTY